MTESNTDDALSACDTHSSIAGKPA